MYHITLSLKADTLSSQWACKSNQMDTEKKTDLQIGYTMERTSITLFSTLEGAEKVELDK